MKRSKSTEQLAREVVAHVQRTELVGRRVRIQRGRGGFGRVQRKWKHRTWAEAKYLVFHYPDPAGHGIVKPDAWYFDYQLEIKE